jgi:hypothetical protein
MPASASALPVSRAEVVRSPVVVEVADANLAGLGEGGSDRCWEVRLERARNSSACFEVLGEPVEDARQPQGPGLGIEAGALARIRHEAAQGSVELGVDALGIEGLPLERRARCGSAHDGGVDACVSQGTQDAMLDLVQAVVPSGDAARRLLPDRPQERSDVADALHGLVSDDHVDGEHVVDVDPEGQALRSGIERDEVTGVETVYESAPCRRGGERRVGHAHPGRVRDLLGIAAQEIGIETPVQTLGLAAAGDEEQSADQALQRVHARKRSNRPFTRGVRRVRRWALAAALMPSAWVG